MPTSEPVATGTAASKLRRTFLAIVASAIVLAVLPPAAGAQSTMPDFALPSWSDVSWRDPSNYSTIQTADIDGDGEDELFGRSSTQVEVHDFDRQTGHWIPLPAVDKPGTFGDDGGWTRPEYYSTIHAGNLDGQGGDEIYGRSSSGIVAFKYDPNAGTWSQLPPFNTSFAPSDANGWEFPQYYTTIQAADIDGDGQDELFGRGKAGIDVWKLDTGSHQWIGLPGMSSFCDDPCGWNHPEYYRTIHAADLDGDGKDEIFARGGDGLVVCSYDAGAVKWSCGPAEHDFSDTDRNGWTDPGHYRSIQAANLDGQPGDEIFGRGSDGIHAVKWHENTNEWEVLPAFTGPDAPADSPGGWNDPSYSLTFMHGDVDGDGRDEVLARSSGGIAVWAFNGSGWEARPGEPDFCDSCDWSTDRYYLTLQTTRTGLNNADQVIGRGLTGVVTYSFDTQRNQWENASPQFPAYTTGDEGASYQAINREIGGAYNRSFDIRESYLSATSKQMGSWSSTIADMSPPPNVSGFVFDQVRDEITTELSNAAQVADWYDGYLTTFTDELYALDTMDQTAQSLSFSASSAAQLGMEEMDVFEGMLDALNIIDASSEPEIAEGAVVVNSLLGGGVTAGLGVDGVNSAAFDELQGTYSQLQDKLRTDFSTAKAGNANAKAAIQSDLGLQSAVGHLISSGAWTQLSGPDQTDAFARSEKAYSLTVWQTISPAILVAYEIDPDDAGAWCANGSCDWQSGANHWQLDWNRSVGGPGCNTVSASLGPCMPASRSVRQQLFGQTSQSCQTAWSSLSCNLGVSYSDVFLGQNGWEDLPAYNCDETGWLNTMKCSLVRGSEPGAPRQAVRMNLGGQKRSIGPVRWFGCNVETHCQTVARGGRPMRAATQTGIKGVKEPASPSIYRTGWAGRPGRHGTEAFRLEVPAADGAYRVRLHFAETRRTKIGRHVFDVDVEDGPKELSEFDVMAAAGGRNRAIVRTFPVNVDDGSVTVRFLRGKGAPMISGIELIPVAKAGTAPVRSGLRLRTARERKGAVHLAGRLTVRGTPRRRLVTIQARARGKRSFETVTTVWTSPTGRFTARVKLRASTVAIRARFAGDSSARPSVSPARHPR